MTDPQPTLPDNGETKTLVADGGLWGTLDLCNGCNGGGIGYSGAGTCSICGGSGELFVEWHMVGTACDKFCNPPMPSDPDEPCDTCGHPMGDHIYHEGACRPGFVCESKCERFVPSW